MTELIEQTAFLKNLFLTSDSQEISFCNDQILPSQTESSLYYKELINFLSEASLDCLSHSEIHPEDINRVFDKKVADYAKIKNYTALSELIALMKKMGFDFSKINLHHLDLPFACNPTFTLIGNIKTLPIGDTPSIKMVLDTEEIFRFSYWIRGVSVNAYPITTFFCGLKSLTYCLPCIKKTPNPHEEAIDFLKKHFTMHLVDQSDPFENVIVKYSNFEHLVMNYTLSKEDYPTNALKVILDTFRFNILCLDLSFSGINAYAMKKLENSLSSLLELKNLNLSGNYLHIDSAKRLPKILNNISLSSLTLNTNLFDAESIQYLAPGLQKQSNLTSLSLSNNAMGSYLSGEQTRLEGALALAYSLQYLTRLTDLSLDYNHFDRQHLQLLHHVLTSLKNLRYLNLSHNNLEGTSPLFFASTLPNTTCILEPFRAET